MSKKENLLAILDEAAKDFLADLDGTAEELLQKSHGGVSRAAVDFIFEIAVVNKRIAARLRFEDPGKWPVEGFVTAPQEFQSKEAARAEFVASLAELRSACVAFPEERFSELVPVPGQEMTYEKLFFVAPWHIVYHDGQLNYIQAMAGDNEMHWN